jgi:hypothetical protein
MAMVAARSEEWNDAIAALVWFLGERRQHSSSAAIMDVVRYSGHLHPTGFHLHFTAVDAAFSALWKIDDKMQLVDLLTLMRQADPTGQRKFAALFERLLSTHELLSIEQCGDDWFTPEFWAKKIEPLRNYAPEDWDRYDAHSLFWELRYSAATRLNPGDPVLQMLARDAVDTVRLQAVSRHNSVRP